LPSLLLALALIGCDGGLSGTGVPPIDNSAGTDPGEEGGSPARPTGDQDAALDAQPRPLENTEAVRQQGIEIRIVNTRADAVALDAGAEAVRLIDRIDALGAAPGTGRVIDDSARMPSRLDAPLRLVSLADDTPLAVFQPLSLVPGSVTTLVARSSTSERASVIALATRIEPPDPTLALLRVVNTLAMDADASGGARVTLVGGEGERELGTIDAAQPATAYAVVAPGEYEVRIGSVGGEAFRLSVGAGEVASGYVVAPAGDGGTMRWVVVVDGG